MGGDHKCPVCQATFTRPQHVARHMRSHTGDRPYKCQYCGDQFARSDLLSRHVNKCHANEKPIPAQGSRRKGSASASRATTSKQACDQCVQSSLPCDGANPCTKCIQRKCRCTYVKFHRQTAPVGPGHNPRPSLPSSVIPGPPSSSRIPMSYPAQDGFFLGPPPTSSSVPTMAETFNDSQAFSFPPLYPDAPHFTSKYRAQAELLRNSAVGAPSSAHFAPTGGTGGGAPVGPGIPGTSPLAIYSELRPPSGNSSWVSWTQEPGSYHHQEPLHDKDIHHGHDSLSHRSQHHNQQHPPSYVGGGGGNNNNSSSSNGHAIPHDLQHSGAGSSYSSRHAAAHPYLRRGSVDFGGSDGSGPPSSADSSSVHLPLNNLSMQQAQTSHSLGYNALDNLPDHRSDYASSDEQGTGGNGSLINQHQHQHHHQQHSGLQGGELGVSSALGSMSLDGPDILLGLDNTTTSFFPGMMSLGGGLPNLSGMPPDDPDATPMPLKENAPPVALTIPMRSASASGVGGGGGNPTTNNVATPRDGDLKELRDFWKQYMRTPFSGPSPSDGPPSLNNINSSGPVMSPPGFRRPRVASMPSSKTPTLTLAAQQNQNQQQHHHNQNDPNHGESGMRTTLKNEDLRSYEAAVLARKAPTTLNLVPKSRRGTIPNSSPPQSHSYHRFSASASPADSTYGGSPVVTSRGLGVVPLVKYDLLGNPDMRPRSSTNSDGSGSSSSLAGAFGRDLQQHQQNLQGGNTSPHVHSQAFMLRRDSPVSTSSTTEDSSSRASSVSFDHDGDTSDDGSALSSSGGDSGRVGRLRPSFKRLASTTLGPANTKRAFLVSSPSSRSNHAVGGINEEDRGGDGSPQLGDQQHSHQMLAPHQNSGVDNLEQGFAPGAIGMH